MTEQEIIEAAEEAGMCNQSWPIPHLIAKRFAKIIEAKTLERAAVVCDEQANEPECPERAKYCAEAIRELKEQK